MMEKTGRLSEQVIVCAQNVSRELGAGFLEQVYENALCVELTLAGIAFRCQPRYGIRYKGQNIGVYIADLVIENRILVELKAVTALSGSHDAQVMNYLKASGISVGLYNFGTPRLGIKRIVWNYDDKAQI